MPSISIHVVDVSRGVVARGLRVEVFATAPARRIIASGAIAENGVLNDAALAAIFPPGHYEAVFHIADYYKNESVPLPATPFLDIVTYRFGITDSRQHYHLPFKMTPWGYSCFRGGA
ncbi:MAG: hydroxyisourate hydrolase [Betaproteobacteria bacterium]|nr:hydroxyisourate hydrolase [Betaproteobacteria bacterium]